MNPKEEAVTLISIDPCSIGAASLQQSEEEACSCAQLQRKLVDPRTWRSSELSICHGQLFRPENELIPNEDAVK